MFMYTYVYLEKKYVKKKNNRSDDLSRKFATESFYIIDYREYYYENSFRGRGKYINHLGYHTLLIALVIVIVANGNDGSFVILSSRATDSSWQGLWEFFFIYEKTRKNECILQIYKNNSLQGRLMHTHCVPWKRNKNK